MPLKFPWEGTLSLPSDGAKVIPSPTAIGGVPSLDGIRVHDLVGGGGRMNYGTLASSVFTDAPGANYHDAYASITAVEDYLIFWVQHLIGIQDGAVFEAELRISFYDTYNIAQWGMPFPGHTVHKHAENPYQDSVSHVLPYPVLLRKGQTLYGNALSVNLGAGNADIQFITLTVLVPVSQLSRIPIFEYSPNRRD